MSPEYQSRVLEDYQIKKTQSRLSYNLLSLTPAKIRQECFIVFDRRFQKRDEKLLRSFFDEKAEDIDLRLAVRRCEADRFRPLIKFLNGRSKTTDEKNIELLAWLIDFADRPYKPEYEKMYDTSTGGDLPKPKILQEEEVLYKVESATPPAPALPEPAPYTEVNITENTGILRIVQIEDDQKEETVGEKVVKRTKPFKRRYSIPLGIVVLLGISLFLWKIYQHKDDALRLIPATGETKQCMYWADDHYEQVHCSQRPQDIEVYAFDPQKAAQLKKITQPDTITLKALGRVWYVKLNGSIEYYTAAGFHPIHTDLRLKPLTVYIYNKYLFHYVENEIP